MTSLAALALAAAAASAAPGPDERRGVELAGAQVQAQIERAAIVRQASGLQHDERGPRPQITRRGRTVLVEFE